VIPASRFQDETGKLHTQQQGLFKKSLYGDFRKGDPVFEAGRDPTLEDQFANPKDAERVRLQKE
jgi:hypothetical protein